MALRREQVAKSFRRPLTYLTNLISLPAGAPAQDARCNSIGCAAVWPLAGRAQQPANMRRIGYLDYGAGMLPSGGFALSAQTLPGGIAGTWLGRETKQPVSSIARRS